MAVTGVHRDNAINYRKSLRRAYVLVLKEKQEWEHIYNPEREFECRVVY